MLSSIYHLSSAWPNLICKYSRVTLKVRLTVSQTSKKLRVGCKRPLTLYITQENHVQNQISEDTTELVTISQSLKRQLNHSRNTHPKVEIVFEVGPQGGAREIKWAQRQRNV